MHPLNPVGWRFRIAHRWRSQGGDSTKMLTFLYISFNNVRISKHVFHTIQAGPAQGVGDIGPRLGWHLTFLYIKNFLKRFLTYISYIK